MSSMLESFCDCYLKFISLAISLSVKKQRTMCWNWEIPEIQANRRCLFRQKPPGQTPHPHETRAVTWKLRTYCSLAPPFQMCSYQLHTFLNMWMHREDHRSGKLEGRKKIPLGKDLKLILKNVRWRMRAGIW